MDLRQTILAEHSKANCNKIVKWVGNSQKRFSELFNLFLNSEYRVNQRACLAPELLRDRSSCVDFPTFGQTGQEFTQTRNS
jgi:hypothetical protein